ncbi:MAG: undecaprenyldiphospho-muramoylpentapeptide beta-N-acetylglucosaminyltransferase [bacterium]|nr:undecaprenyldiphospho-muramoylpentapeptide beta-N-acetylglucosaminyltransferase [bacterium]
MNIFIAAGGTGGHIFPALSVALELQKQCKECSLLWIGTSRNREQELGERYGIPVKILDVSGITRKIALSNITALSEFVGAVQHMNTYYKENRPDAVVAFGGYVCAPVLAAARLKSIPYFLQEQNSVPGLVNRVFAAKSQHSFLGFPLTGKHTLKGNTTVTGTPVRAVTGTFEDFKYPEGLEKEKKTILICGGSQGAVSMNDCLIEPVKGMLEGGQQVVWQTGAVSYKSIAQEFDEYPGAFIFESIDDLYPYYAVAELVICRSGASTLNEIAYFGRACIMIPLPWSAENHQWMNAGFVQSGGWGIRIKQDKQCPGQVTEALDKILTDRNRYENMCRKALDNSPSHAAADIARKIVEQVG